MNPWDWPRLRRQRAGSRAGAEPPPTGALGGRAFEGVMLTDHPELCRKPVTEPGHTNDTRGLVPKLGRSVSC